MLSAVLLQDTIAEQLQAEDFLNVISLKGQADVSKRNAPWVQGISLSRMHDRLVTTTEKPCILCQKLSKV